MKQYYYAFYNDEILLQRQDDGTFTIPYQNLPPTDPIEESIMNVQLFDGSEVKAYYMKEPLLVNAKYEMCKLRASYYKLSHKQYLNAGKCKELLFWNTNTRYCGVCGSQMKFSTAISKVCTKCGKEIWPQLGIAIIVLVHRENDVLLVHARNFKSNFFGLVAGFVETGETLEEAVKREVMEEAGISIKNIKYFSSQPWPYPCGLMIGFNADYESGTLKLQQSELSAGDWFNRDSLPDIPEKLSIGRMLIDSWLNKTV